MPLSSATPPPPVLGGKSMRLSRICDPHSRRGLIVPMDHSVTIGPLGRADHTERVVGALAAAGANAVVLHRGRIAHVDPVHFAHMGLIVHLSAGTRLSLDPDAKTLVCDVPAAIRCGADAVSVHVNIGAPTEARQLADLAAVAGQCEVFGMPLLAMMYLRGPAHRDTRPTVAELAHLAAIATDLGADLVKLDYSGSTETMAEVVDRSALPVFVAGGAPIGTTAEVVDRAAQILDSGVAGLSFGRTVFDSPDPHTTAAALVDLIRRRTGDGHTAPVHEARLQSHPA